MEGVGSEDGSVGNEDVGPGESLPGREGGNRAGGAVAADGIGGVGQEGERIDLLLPDGLYGVVACGNGEGVEDIVAPCRCDNHVGLLKHDGSLGIEEGSFACGAAPRASEDEDAVG